METVALRGERPSRSAPMRSIVLSLAALAALSLGSVARAEKWYVCGIGTCVPSPAYCPGHDKRSWGSCLPPGTRTAQRARKPYR